MGGLGGLRRRFGRLRDTGQAVEQRRAVRLGHLIELRHRTIVLRKQDAYLLDQILERLIERLDILRCTRVLRRQIARLQVLRRILPVLDLEKDGFVHILLHRGANDVVLELVHIRPGGRLSLLRIVELPLRNGLCLPRLFELQLDVTDRIRVGQTHRHEILLELVLLLGRLHRSLGILDPLAGLCHGGVGFLGRIVHIPIFALGEVPPLLHPHAGRVPRVDQILKALRDIIRIGQDGCLPGLGQVRVRQTVTVEFERIGAGVRGVDAAIPQPHVVGAPYVTVASTLPFTLPLLVALAFGLLGLLRERPGDGIAGVLDRPVVLLNLGLLVERHLLLLRFRLVPGAGVVQRPSQRRGIVGRCRRHRVRIAIRQLDQRRLVEVELTRRDVRHGAAVDLRIPHVVQVPGHDIRIIGDARHVRRTRRGPPPGYPLEPVPAILRHGGGSGRVGKIIENRGGRGTVRGGSVVAVDAQVGDGARAPGVRIVEQPGQLPSNFIEIDEFRGSGRRGALLQIVQYLERILPGSQLLGELLPDVGVPLVRLEILQLVGCLERVERRGGILHVRPRQGGGILQAGARLLVHPARVIGDRG